MRRWAFITLTLGLSLSGYASVAPHGNPFSFDNDPDLCDRIRLETVDVNTCSAAMLQVVLNLTDFEALHLVRLRPFVDRQDLEARVKFSPQDAYQLHQTLRSAEVYFSGPGQPVRAHRDLLQECLQRFEGTPPEHEYPYVE